MKPRDEAMNDMPLTHLALSHTITSPLIYIQEMGMDEGSCVRDK